MNVSNTQVFHMRTIPVQSTSQNVWRAVESLRHKLNPFLPHLTWLRPASARQHRAGGRSQCLPNALTLNDPAFLGQLRNDNDVKRVSGKQEANDLRRSAGIWSADCIYRFGKIGIVHEKLEYQAVIWTICDMNLGGIILSYNFSVLLFCNIKCFGTTNLACKRARRDLWSLHSFAPLQTQNTIFAELYSILWTHILFLLFLKMISTL